MTLHNASRLMLYPNGKGDLQITDGEKPPPQLKDY